MGYLRLLLSIAIAKVHWVGDDPWDYAVMGSFYLLSGYGITASGIKPGFWPRRFWRLWPSYVAIAAVTQLALLLGWVPGSPLIGLAYGWGGMLQFVMIVPTFPASSLVPTAWMIKWLLVGYLLMWLGASRTPQRSGVWVIASLMVSAFYLADNSYDAYYKSALFSLLFTAIGAACYHLGLIAPRDDRWASFAGALSYPVFLAHYGIGAAMASITGWAPGWPLFWHSLPPTLCLSWLFVLWVEQPIARYRRRPTP
jgi:peptidoglycan/LPS O-acetylase OafA/YrhL